MRSLVGLGIPLVALGALAGGCHQDFSDDGFGVLDLASTYDGGTRSDPSAGVPTQIDPLAGFVDGQQAEYYDFGTVPVKVNPSTREPLAVLVQPMYFFFDHENRPLFSNPVRETRDGTDWMLGGHQVRNPNPKDFCAGVADAEAKKDPCLALNKNQKQKPYPQRDRDLLVDPMRMTADYQRPVIDVIPGSTGLLDATYTGFWEVVEVIAPPGYQPDSIKHKATLDKAIDSGDFKVHYTGRAINCPLVDERTHVSLGVTDRPTPRPRIELWYRRKMASCYLANGWETLGTGDGQAYFAGQDDDRVDTFDVSRIVAGDGKAQKTQLVVPVGRAFEPTIYTFDQGGGPPAVTHVVDNLLTRGRPRHADTDPPGYRPVRWLWDLRVAADGPVDKQTGAMGYQSGAIRSVDDVDASITSPRTTSFGADARFVVRNIPLRGVAVRCGWPQDVKSADPLKSNGNKFQCGRAVPDPDMPDNPNAHVVDARNDPVCTKIGLECNKDTCFCDAPFVGYGQACGPGIAQCSPDKDALNDTGYVCFPPWGGFCHLKCGMGSNARAGENQDKKPPQFVDTRCKELPGYVCLNAFGNPTCLRFCDQNVMDPNQCSATTTAGKDAVDLGAGQTCQDWGLQICTWPEGYTPSN